MKNTKNVKAKHKDLEALEEIIDKGKGNAEVVNKRMEVVKTLQDIDKLQSLEMAQKAKVKWSIEGGENSSFFHGVLNKKRSQLTIRGIMVDGIWTDSPNMVELELDVSKEEIKRAVWDCGTDRSSSPDVEKETILIFKVDFEKAYDSVRWDFLDDVLKKFGFGDKWCNWTQSCLRSSRGSIIINGSPTEEFQFYKGLKQGDPLSPFLFILVMESLHLSFQRVVDAGMYKGIKLSPSLNLSHMFYTDDAVFVGQWCDGNINTLVHVLECFFRASGLRINTSKSKLMGVLVERDKVKCAAAKLGCLILKTPFSYLGSMPIFHMSIFRVPLSVLRMLESIRSHFFNGHELKSLMYKWVWRFYTQFTSLWARVIKAIHGDDMKVGTYAKAGIQSCWMNIVHEINALKKQGINLLDCMHVKLGNGEKIAFWEDIWVGDNALKNLYPRMYALETCKSVTVGTKLAHSSLESSFRCKPRGGVEQEQYDALSGQVHDVTFVPMSDRWIWSLESSGDFSVASVRKVIDDKLLLDVGTKTRWIKSVPIKVNDHAWKVKIDSLPTRFNISRRGIDIESIMCSICDNGAESTSHLIFTCHMVRDIIRKITSWWDVTYVEVDSYEHWIAWLVNLRLSSKHKQLLARVFDINKIAVLKKISSEYAADWIYFDIID
ncbi:RNA-directed DNA polymerase, eukaryota, reverse transcriptase zinc-binding domain protein [Tanacetum coccineum]